jgi:hypothetical protein
LLGPLYNLLDAVIKATQADFGDLQLIDSNSGGLRIVAQRGFENDFLDFFRCVNDESTACGVALKRRRRVIVKDITRHSIYCGPASRATLEALLSARVRALHSTPLYNSSGNVIGVLSALYNKPMSASIEMLLRREPIGKPTIALMGPNNGEHARRVLKQKSLGPEIGICPRRMCDFVLEVDDCRERLKLADSTCPQCGLFLIFFCFNCFAPIKSRAAECGACGCALRML